MNNSELPKLPTAADVQWAQNRIAGKPHHTPVLSSDSINQIVGAELYFKCENFQKVGAFKFRGAVHALSCLSQSELKNGVATHSSGNHAAALALAAKMYRTKAYIVMPSNSPAIKKIAVAGYGAEITYCEPTLEARQTALDQIVEKTGAIFIHPYDNFNVIAGQGTAALEMLDDMQQFIPRRIIIHGDEWEFDNHDKRLLDIIMTPVGGGGLLSGTALIVKHMLRRILVIAAEPEGADDAYRSFTSKQFVPSINPQTIADGLLTSLGKLTFPIIQQNVDAIVTVSEKAIVDAMRMIWERMKIIVEPSAAVTLAAILEQKFDYRGKRIGIILSGGNVDLDNLPFRK